MSKIIVNGITYEVDIEAMKKAGISLLCQPEIEITPEHMAIKSTDNVDTIIKQIISRQTAESLSIIMLYDAIIISDYLADNEMCAKYVRIIRMSLMDKITIITSFDRKIYPRSLYEYIIDSGSEHPIQTYCDLLFTTEQAKSLAAIVDKYQDNKYPNIPTSILVYIASPKIYKYKDALYRVLMH